MIYFVWGVNFYVLYRFCSMRRSSDKIDIAEVLNLCFWAPLRLWSGSVRDKFVFMMVGVQSSIVSSIVSGTPVP